MLFFSAGTSSSLPTREESGLGVIGYDGLKEILEKKSKRVNNKFTEKQRFLIGNYTAINGPGAAVRTFRKSHPCLKFEESQARGLRRKYLDQKKKGPNVDKEIGTLKRGRPLLETVDEKVSNFLQIVRRKEGVLISVVAIATAKALIAKSDLEHLKALDRENLSWTKSLFRRMGFVRRAKATSKPEIPECAENEAALILHRQIVDLVYSAPSNCRFC